MIYIEAHVKFTEEPIRGILHFYYCFLFLSFLLILRVSIYLLTLLIYFCISKNSFDINISILISYFKLLA